MNNTATAAPEAPAQRVTRYGRFPMTECGRCGGSGRMPYSVQGGVCFDCQGSGLVVVKEHRAAYAELIASIGPKNRHAIALVRRHLDGERVQVAHDQKWKSIRSAEYRLEGRCTGGGTTTSQGVTIEHSRLSWVVAFTLADGSVVDHFGDLLRSRILPA